MCSVFMFHVSSFWYEVIISYALHDLGSPLKPTPCQLKCFRYSENALNSNWNSPIINISENDCKLIESSANGIENQLVGYDGLVAFVGSSGIWWCDLISNLLMSKWITYEIIMNHASIGENMWNIPEMRVMFAHSCLKMI